MSDLAALQGSWKQTDLQADGVSNPPDETSTPDAITTFNENRFFVRSLDGALLLHGTFELAESTNPKSVNWMDATGPDTGKILPAIYRLEGDLFVFVAADRGSPRPTAFRTVSGQAMRSFKRS